jgi:hypothetical protein
MNKKFKAIARLFLTGLTISLIAGTAFSQPDWRKDFIYQELDKRPDLEVRYTDTHRDAFEIIAEAYQLTGDLLKPNLLVETNTQEPWLWFEMTDKQGKTYSTMNTSAKSRINLYRRGPYFNEIHWFDLKFAGVNGDDLPLRAEVILYCFPEKIKGSIKLFPSDDIAIATFSSKGKNAKKFDIKPVVKDKYQYFNFDLYGEEKPLGDQAFTMKKGKTAITYDHRRGVYKVGSETVDGFQRQYFESPNGYEEVSFKIKNDGVPRKIYICHETLVGEGIVEGGAVLDETGHPLPLLVQVCKNFDGEKEERFYNPRDTAFSETYFPLYLEPFEELDISSLHLYQNWGRHMTKHWSSLGFFMDYFHTSTGVTETTCYIPFKFGHKTGIAIGDFRAMSQNTFWSGQPQHDNVAGHNFLTYYDGSKWNYSEYQGTVYKSTGNNWCHVEMKYLSSDSCFQLVVDIWEVPQDDELRSFFTATYKVLRPLRIENARENFRFLDISSTQQSLRYTDFSYTGVSGKVITKPIEFGADPFSARGIEIPTENSFVAVTGEPKGSNGVMVRRFISNSGVKPAFSIQHKTTIPEPKDTTVNEHKVYTPDLKPGDIRLSLVPSTDLLVLKPGDEITLSGYWLPYGEFTGAETPVREIATFGSKTPEITAIKKGFVLENFPATIQVDQNQAEFTMKGGFNLVPVIANGFTTFRNLQIFRKINNGWQQEYHHQNSMYDGNQVFIDSEGKFGAVFLVMTNGKEQEFLIRPGENSEIPQKMAIAPVKGPGAVVNVENLVLKNGFRLGINPALKYKSPLAWKESEGNSFWFSSSSEKILSGARVTGFEENAAIQCWWQPAAVSDTLYSPVIELQSADNIVKGKYELTIYRNGRLEAMETAKPFNVDLQKGDYGIVVLFDPATNQSTALAFSDVGKIALKNKNTLSFQINEQLCQQGRRKVFQGYFYQLKGSPAALLEHVKQHMPVRVY